MTEDGMKTAAGNSVEKPMQAAAGASQSALDREPASCPAQEPFSFSDKRLSLPPPRIDAGHEVLRAILGSVRRLPRAQRAPSTSGIASSSSRPIGRPWRPTEVEMAPGGEGRHVPPISQRGCGPGEIHLYHRLPLPTWF
ncbi:hypothetical protein A0H81_10057 [Grifola frondosa]|uniref:Uncharacterized protein n=1 Tax=Grifola frondosa TaxID=5627 RepID=A0A1C7LZ05_GRIFR|nr:hypothetical protein A0H81_10057 [Grifola frondosa]